MAHIAKPRKMTEQQWLNYRTPLGMLKFLRRRASLRKRRLYAAACCRLVWSAFPDDVRMAIEASEAFADGLISESERRRTAREIDWREAKWEGIGAWRWIQDAARAAISKVERTAGFVAPLLPIRGIDPDHDSSNQRVCDLLREVVNPFASPFHPSWRTPNVVALAEAFYADRDQGDLPILADALMDAGCTDDALIKHCQSPGPHVRGCWAVDLILGKE